MLFITAIENFLLFSTLLTLVGFGLAWAVRHLSNNGRLRIQPFTLTRIYGMALVLPPVVSAWLIAAALLPHWWLGETAFDAAHSAPLHHLHLFSEMTAALEPGLAYLTLCFVVTACAFAAWSSLRGYNRIGQIVKRLEMNASPPPYEKVALVEAAAKRHRFNVGLVMSDYPLSFVWGFRRSKLVLSSGLLHALTGEQLTGVLEHEAAHHRRRDNVVKLVLTACSYLSMAFPVSRLVLRWRAEQVELVCDEVAVAATSAPLEIAEALVKLRRRTSVPGDSLATTLASGFVTNDRPSFEQRIRRLLAFADALPTLARSSVLSRMPRGEALVILSFFIATLVGIISLAPLAVHHAAESIIQLFG